MFYETVFLVVYGRKGDGAVTKGMRLRQKMAVREGKSPWRRGQSRSGGKDLLLQ